MQFDETGIVEYELERMRIESRPETNLDPIPSKRLSFGKVFLWLMVGLLLFRLILEIINFIGNMRF